MGRAGQVPTATQIETAELAINVADRQLFSKDDAGVVFSVAGYAISATPPGAAARKTGMLWVDISGSPAVKAWDGTNWVSASVDKKYFYTDHTAA